MCTVTVINLPDGCWRVACNRDEQRSRPVALPPDAATVSGVPAVYPIDQPAGGTWIGANARGFVATVLNVNPFEPIEASPHAPSRGTLIPEILGEASVPAALRQVGRLDLSGFAPFRLVLMDDEHIAVVRQVCGSVEISPLQPRDQALIFTSSGLGDHLVEDRRAQLFRKWSRRPWTSEHQDDFHRHRWDDWPELSVNMARVDACTVSTTVVDITPETVSMRYHGAAPDDPADDVTRQLPRSRNAE
jgi:hypothetical protein